MLRTEKISAPSELNHLQDPDAAKELLSVMAAGGVSLGDRWPTPPSLASRLQAGPMHHGLSILAPLRSAVPR